MIISVSSLLSLALDKAPANTSVLGWVTGFGVLCPSGSLVWPGVPQSWGLNPCQALCQGLCQELCPGASSPCTARGASG